MIQKLIAINTELYLPQIYVKYFNIHDKAKNIHKIHNMYFPMRLRTFLVFKYKSLFFYLIIAQNKIYVKLY